jgi:hypothetical protein
MRESTGSPNQATTAHSSKRRHYAVNQAQAYSGATETMGYGDATYVGGQLNQPIQQQQPAQLFTPGLSGDNHWDAQQGQQQPPYFQGQDSQYINGPGYPQQQQPPYVHQQQHPVGQLADQFSQLGMGGQKPVSLLYRLRSWYLEVEFHQVLSSDCKFDGTSPGSHGTITPSARSSATSKCESFDKPPFLNRLINSRPLFRIHRLRCQIRLTKDAP